MITLNTITKYEIISSKSKTYKEFFGMIRFIDNEYKLVDYENKEMRIKKIIKIKSRIFSQRLSFIFYMKIFIFTFENLIFFLNFMFYLIYKYIYIYI